MTLSWEERIRRFLLRVLPKVSCGCGISADERA